VTKTATGDVLCLLSSVNCVYYELKENIFKEADDLRITGRSTLWQATARMGSPRARRSWNRLNAFVGLNFGVVAIFAVLPRSLISLSEANNDANLKAIIILTFIIKIVCFSKSNH
jgi:hypothetical protein